MIEQLEKWMHQRIRLFLANGGQLKRGTFGRGNCRCAVSACYDYENPGLDQIRDFIAASGLPLEYEAHVWAIVSGFDGKMTGHRCDPAYYDLGKRLAAEYL